jgi:hypothetical protein
LLASWLADNFDAAVATPAESVFVAFSQVRTELERRASGADAALGDYACTIVAAAMRDDGCWIAWHLGDGGIIARFEQVARVLSSPQKGEFANVTHFVTDSDAYSRVEVFGSPVAGEPPPSGLMLFSDGVEGSLFERATGKVAPAVDKMLGWHDLGTEQEVSAALHSNLFEVFRSLTGDDCTIVLLAPATTVPAEEAVQVTAPVGDP